MTIFNGKLLSHDLSFDLDADWIQTSVTKGDLETAFNVIMILEMLMAQLTGVFNLTTTQAMQSDIHRTCMILINNPFIMQLIHVFIIEDTYIYSKEVSDINLKQDKTALDNMKGAQNSRFKNISPYGGMSSDSLSKYRVGYKFSIIGKIQSYPVYYSAKLEQNIKERIKNLNGFSLIDITTGIIEMYSPFPDYVEDAIEFIRERFVSKNPHVIDSEEQETNLTKALRIQLENNIPKDLSYLNTDNLTSPQEKERAKKIQEKLKEWSRKGKTKKGK